LRDLIERHPGWEVCEAPDGEEAVRKSQQSAPDAVVLNLRMPEMDGLTAGRRLTQLMPELPMALSAQIHRLPVLSEGKLLRVNYLMLLFQCFRRALIGGTIPRFLAYDSGTMPPTFALGRQFASSPWQARRAFMICESTPNGLRLITRQDRHSTN
jgi:hypothetical protein